MRWLQRSSGRARLQRTGTSNTKLLDAELLFLGGPIDDPRPRLVLPEVGVAVVLEKVGEQMVEVPVGAEEVVIQVGVQLQTFATPSHAAPTRSHINPGRIYFDVRPPAVHLASKGLSTSQRRSSTKHRTRSEHGQGPAEIASDRGLELETRIQFNLLLWNRNLLATCLHCS